MNKLLTCKCGSQYQDAIFAVLRVATGFAFFFHGYDKVFNTGMEGVTGFFTSVGIPAASLLAPLVAYGELIGGLMIMAGFLTHWVSKVNVLIMLGAIWFVHLKNGYNAMADGYEYQLLLLVVSVFFIIWGSGKYSVDHRYSKRKSEETMGTGTI